MIEESVVEAVLGAALQTGGEFAEVFVEDRRGSAARLDDGRVEDLASGRDQAPASGWSSARRPALPTPVT